MNLIRNYRNWRRYRDTVNELSRLSNRELTDLGISRGRNRHRRAARPLTVADTARRLLPPRALPLPKPAGHRPAGFVFL